MPHKLISSAKADSQYFHRRNQRARGNRTGGSMSDAIVTKEGGDFAAQNHTHLD